jgi:hypothetical protein
MLEGTHTVEASGVKGTSQEHLQYRIDAVAWGATVLSTPAKHSYGIRFDINDDTGDPTSQPVFQFTLDLANARELGEWLVKKAEQLVT